MLDTLTEIMGRELPGLLADPTTPWSSLDVTYEDPHVERLWIQLGEFRLNLHRIHPCGSALYHPHPWPSAVAVLSGRYEMGVGYTESDEFKPVTVSTVLLSAGSGYEMLHPFGWHYVRPVGGPSYSVMLTGKPWDMRGLEPKGKGRAHGPLKDYVRDEVLAGFRALVPGTL